ncbi:MAG: leucine-rich repeat protein [Clostridia bacterium]|nr:leucine-rich repeat protein [Clostridia bacterium]
MKTCPKCGTQTDGRYCPKCGCDTDKIKNPTSCPKCREKLKGRFCQNCGYDTRKSKPLPMFLAKTIDFIKKKKMPIIVTSSLSVLVIVSTILIISFFTNIYTVRKLKEIELGMTKEQVIDILGTPSDVSDSDNIFYYFEKKVEKKYNNIEKYLIDDWNKLEEEYAELEKMVYKYIRIEFGLNGVSEIFLDLSHRYSEDDDYKTNNIKKLKKLELNTPTLEVFKVQTDNGYDYCLVDNLTSIEYSSVFLDGSYFKGYANLEPLDCNDFQTSLFWENPIFKFTYSTPIFICGQIDSNGELLSYVGNKTFLELANVVSIAENAFNQNESLEFVSLNGVNNISAGAFNNCDNLKAVFFPIDIQVPIGASPFVDCDNLVGILTTSFTAPTNWSFAEVFTIDDWSINKDGGYHVWNKWEKSFTTHSRNCKICNETISGEHELDNYYCFSCGDLSCYDLEFVLNKNKDGYIVQSKGTCTDPYVIIPSVVNNLPVVAIESNAFHNCLDLTTIVIPSSIVSIGSSAFSYCRNLSSVHITDISSWCNISFVNYYSNPLSYAGNLYLNNELVSELVIPDGVKKIEAYAFDGCTSLTSVTVPDSITSIGDYAFNNCNNLTAVNITDISSWCNISFGNYYSNPLAKACNLYLNNKLVSELVIPDGVKQITAHAFNGCTSLTSVTVPDSVTHIGYDAFDNCNNLTAVNITEISSWCNISFSSNPLTCAGNLYLNNELVSELVIPDGVKKIEAHAFKGCTSLTSVTVPDSITSIGDYAFNNCNNLTAVNITDISSWCNIYFDYIDSNPLSYAGNLYLNNELVSELVIPDGVKQITARAFNGCTSLTIVTVPDSVTYIGYDAFDDCDNLKELTLPFVGTSSSNNLRSIFGSTLPSSLKKVSITGGTSITTNSFKDCSNLTSISIPNSVNSIDRSAFSDCSSLVEITLPFLGVQRDATYTYFGSIFGAYDYKDNGSFVPSTLKKVTITGGSKIGSNSFIDCSNLTDVVIQGNILSIDEFAFKNCANLRTIIIPNGVTSIDRGAFYRCSSLEKIVIPNSVTYIGLSIFEYCTNLKELSVPFITTDTTNRLFGSANPTSLKKLEITGGSAIDSFEFYGYSYLTNIVISDSITSIGKCAFYDCSNLTSIILSNNVTTINDSTFNGCSSLSSIIIPKSVTIINNNAFCRCSSLSKVYYKGTISDWNNVSCDNLGNDDFYNATIYFYSEIEPIEPGNYWHYDSDGFTPIVW